VILAIPVSREASAPFTLAASKSTPVKAPYAGTLDTVLVTEGQAVKAGELLARYDGAEAKKRADAANAKATELQQQLKRLEAQGHSPKVAKARAAQIKREAQAAKATADRDKLAAKLKGKKNAALAKADKQVAALQAAVQKGAVELDALSQGKAIAKVQEELKTRQAERDGLAAQAKLGEIKASTDGTVMGLSAKPHEAVGADQSLCALADIGTLHAVIRVPLKEAEAVHAGDTVSLRALGKPVTAQIAGIGAEEKSEPGSAERYLEARVDVPNPEGKLKPGTAGTASLKLGSEALLRRLFGH
jgi:multidrug efflux pump subunit AcrA (membrane-fusion protein)